MRALVASFGREALVAALAVSGIALSWIAPLGSTWRTAPDLGHAWVAPLLMAYLWWERWPSRPPLLARPSVGRRWWLLAAIIGFIHLFLRLFLTPFPLWPALLLAYSAVIVATILTIAWLLAGRPGVRWISGPLILLVSTIPIPSTIETSIILPLRETWASLAAELINVFGFPALALGTSVKVGTGWVGVDEACGGIRSLQACLMAALFFGEWYKYSIGRRIGLISLAILAALVGNFFRVLFLSTRSIAGAGAVENAHDAAGWIAMGASLLATGWLACRWSGYRWPPAAIPFPRSSGASESLTPASRPPIAPGWTWALVVGALFIISEAGTRIWFRVGQLNIADLSQWTAQFPENHWSFRSAPLPDTARSMLQPDLFRAGNWRDESGVRVSAHYIEWQRGQVARSIPFLHNPTVCLPLAGCELVSSLEPLHVAHGNGVIQFHAYKFRQAGEELLVAFTIWDPARGAALTRPPAALDWTGWWKMQWREVREAREHQPAQLLTITVPWSDDAPRSATAILNEIVHPWGNAR